MTEYQGNSNRDKKKASNMEAKAPQIAKPMAINATVTKRSGVDKLLHLFFEKDLKSISDYVINDTLIPSFKKLIWDTFTNGIHMSLFGEPDESHRDINDNTSRISYWTSSKKQEANKRVQYQNRVSMDYENLVFPTRGDAELALDQLRAMLNHYDFVRVSDLYDLVGITCDSTWYAYGWTNLTNATVTTVRTGYILKLPKAIPLN